MNEHLIVSLLNRLYGQIEHFFFKRWRIGLREKKVLESIKRLSEFYLKYPEAQTPWSESWALWGYMAYFFPLNVLRIWRFWHQWLPWSDFLKHNQVLEYGCGLSPLGWILWNLKPAWLRQNRLILWDQYQNLQKIIHEWAQFPWEWQSNEKILDTRKSLVFLMQVLTEGISKVSDKFQNFHTIWIIEPGTNFDSRRLLMLRQDLIEKGWIIKAPCTHQEKCPILTWSQRDWCHDRWNISTIMGLTYWRDIWREIPFLKDGWMSASYLWATRQIDGQIQDCRFRVISQWLVRKGFQEVSICSNSQRVFLKVPNRHPYVSEWIKLQRGDTVQFFDGFFIQKGISSHKIWEPLSDCYPIKSEKGLYWLIQKAQ